MTTSELIMRLKAIDPSGEAVVLVPGGHKAIIRWAFAMEDEGPTGKTEYRLLDKRDYKVSDLTRAKDVILVSGGK